MDCIINSLVIRYSKLISFCYLQIWFRWYWNETSSKMTKQVLVLLQLGRARSKTVYINIFKNRLITLTQPERINHLFYWLHCRFSIKMRNFDHTCIFSWMKLFRMSKRICVYNVIIDVNAQILKTCRLPQDRWKILRFYWVQRIDFPPQWCSVFAKND